MAVADLYSLQDRLSALDVHYSALRSRWVTDEAYYDGTFTFSLPDGVNKIVPATGRNAVEVPQTHIVTDKPIVRRDRNPKGKREEKDDDVVESFYAAFLEANEIYAETPPLHEAVKFQLLRGEAILSGPFLNIDKLKSGDVDWVWYDTLDPANVLLEPGPDPRNGFVVEVLTVDEMEQRADTDSRFRSFKRNGRGGTDYITLVQWYGYVTGEKFVQYASWEGSYASVSDIISVLTIDVAKAIAEDWLVAPHSSGYPYLPFVKVYSGYGTRSRNPEKLSVPIINAQVKSLLVGEAYALSVADAYMGLATFERYGAESQAQLDAMALDFAPGSGSVIPRGVTKLQNDPIPVAVLQNYSNVRQALQEALFSGVVQGQRPEGVRTASGLAILSGQARLKFGAPLRFLQNGGARVLYNLGQLLDLNQDQGPFSIEGHSLNPKQFHSDYSARVKLLAEDPEEESARIGTGLQLWGKLASRTIGERFWRVEDWSKEEEQILYERLINGDAMQMTLEAYLQLQMPEEKPKPGGGERGGGLDAIRTLNAAARIMRANRPGGQPQQTPLPGSTEQQAQAQSRMAGIGRVGERR
mgnify:CR=1 FL=1